MIKIAIDVMGGDNCPGCNIDGVRLAIKKTDDTEFILVGPEQLINETIEKSGDIPKERYSVVNAEEVISLDESPVAAIRKKKDSTIVVGSKLVKEGKADAFITAGSSGAAVAAGQLIIGRLKGVMRPPLAYICPNLNGVSLFLDIGGNVDARPEWLCQYARIGSLYMQHVMHVENPVVKLINIGLEEEKGNDLTKKTNALLMKMRNLNYKGYMESREFPFGGADVIITDAFTGNVMIKLFEGTAKAMMTVVKKSLMSSVSSKIGALFVKKPLKENFKSFDASEHGGAPLIGIKGLVVKAHGNSTAKEISNAIEQCRTYINAGINDYIVSALEEDSELLSNNTDN